MTHNQEHAFSPCLGPRRTNCRVRFAGKPNIDFLNTDLECSRTAKTKCPTTFKPDRPRDPLAYATRLKTNPRALPYPEGMTNEDLKHLHERFSHREQQAVREVVRSRLADDLDQNECR